MVKFVCHGDSLTAAGSGYAPTFGTMYTPDRVVKDLGAGGTSIATAYATQILAANAQYRDRVMLIHDKCGVGSDGTVAAYLAIIQNMVAYQSSGKFLIIGGIYSTNGAQEPGSADYIFQTEVNDGLLALYPNNYLHVADLLADASTRSDDVHLTATARDTILIPAIAQKLVDLGYMNVTS